MWSKTYTFSPSTIISSAEVNQNFDDLVNAVNEAMPSGMITAFSGAVASIPSGFYLCNGSNGTPDLRGKFIAGAGGAYAVGDTGGENTHVLVEAELAAHAHTTPAHNHDLYVKSSSGSGDALASATSGATSHSTYGQYAASGAGTSGSAGSGTAHENRPPFHALAWIMKS